MKIRICRIFCDRKLKHIETSRLGARQFASFNAKLDSLIFGIRPVSFSQLLLQRSNLLIFRPGGGETARFDITTFVQSYRLQTRGQSQQEVRLQGRTREHEDLPLRG